MFDRLGKRRFILPFAIAILAGLMFTLMLYPIAKMEVRDLPFGIVNLDQGATTPAGEVNAGAAMVEGMTGAQDASASDETSSPVSWITYENASEMDAAFDNSEIYGALVVPDDFTAAQMAVAAGMSEETPAVEVYLDMAKSPMVANLMSTSITTMLGEAGVTAEVTVLNEGPSADGASALTSLMSQNFLIMPLVMLSAMLGVIMTLLLAPKREAGRKERFASAGKQVAFSAVISCVVALVVLFLARFALGFEESLGAIFGFAWVSSFCVMTCVLGFTNIALPLGALVAVCALLGMGCGMLAPEMLPAFWQDWIYPWAPQHFIGDGMRSIIYLGEGALNNSCIPLAIMAVAGLAALFVSPLLPKKTSSEA